MQKGEINLPIGKDTLAGPPLYTIDFSKEGRPAETHWKVRKAGKYNTIVELQPYTGRTHQLRLHLTASGHPILGDFFYSTPPVYRASPRLLLHAERLSLLHPRSGNSISILAPCEFSLEEFDLEILP